MVQILPILTAAALLAQTAFGAAVPVKRSQYSNSNNNNNYEASNSNNQYQGSSNQYQNSNQYNQNSNQYEQSQNQDSNQYGNQYNQNQDSNQYANQDSNQYANQQQNTEYNQQQNTEYQVSTTESMMMEEATSTAEAMSMETTPSYEIPSYGSGSSSNAGYNDCVSQCMAQFGAPPSAVTMDSESMPEAAGTGAVHTVMVAPDGVGLRYVPFAVNASIGDTIRYVWTTPLNHTVTMSSALTICNKSAEAESRNFVSGIRSAATGTQTFDVTVETEEPQFFYCSVAQHCIKGMFGVVNPGSDVGGANTIGTMMASMMASNPQLQAANEYIRQNVSDRSVQNWGSDISLAGFSESQITEIVSNVMFTRAVYGANPGMLDFNQGAATPDGSPIMIPQGLNVLLSNTAANAPATTIPATAIATPTGTGTIVAPLAQGGAFSIKGGVSVWAAAFVGALGYLLI